MSGELAPAQQLPSEAALATEFGVSRPTIREALRELAALSLIRTVKGSNGGSFVTVPSADHISDFLSANIQLLSQADHVALDEFLEARSLLEIPAARLAARRRTEEDLELLRAAIPEGLAEREEQFTYNKNFHSSLVAASGNTLLTICAQPIFSVLQAGLRRSSQSQQFHDRIKDDHRALIVSLETGDESLAEELMLGHLDFLSKVYRQVWQQPTDGSRE